MQLVNLQKTIEEFRDKVIKESKDNLRKLGKGGGDLERSIKAGPVKVTDRSLQFEIEMEYYGTFQDQGVQGKSSNAKAPKSPYRFGKKTGRKGGLTEGIDKWVRKKRFQFREKKTGRFMSYSSTAYLITRSIYLTGIKPSLFFTKPFEKYAKGLPKELEKAFALDTQAFLEFTTKQQLKNYPNGQD